jgi:hypothetical protein
MGCLHAKCLFCKRFDQIREAEDEITEDLDIVSIMELLSNFNKAKKRADLKTEQVLSI